MLPIVATVVSMPADNSERTSSEASSSVMSPVSQAAYMVYPKPPALSASRRHHAVIQGTTSSAQAIESRLI